MLRGHQTQKRYSRQVDLQGMYLGFASFITITVTPKQQYDCITPNEQLCQMLIFSAKPSQDPVYTRI